jgi:hypothetical protein
MGGGKVGYPHVFANPAVESAIQNQRKKTSAKAVSSRGEHPVFWKGLSFPRNGAA